MLTGFYGNTGTGFYKGECFTVTRFLRFLNVSQHQPSSAPGPEPLARAPLYRQRSGGWKPPPHWAYQDIENRGGMLLPLVLVPAIRYTQDTPQDKNQLLARDVAALGSSTMLYLYLQRLLSGQVSRLGQLAQTREKLQKVPQAFQWAVEKVGAYADEALKDKGEEGKNKFKALDFKNKFWSYVPAQAVALTVSALVGPAIGAMAMRHTKHFMQWLRSPNKIANAQNAWNAQTETEQKRHSLELASGTFGAVVAVPLAYRGVNHWDVQKKYGASTLFRLIDHDLPVWGTALLGVVGASKLLGRLIYPRTPQEKAAHPDERSGGAGTPVHDGKAPVVKAPVIGASLLGASYAAALTAAGIYTHKNRNDKVKLKALYNHESAYHAMHWILPSLLLPSIRYTRDDKTRRDEYYIRDFTNFWLGAVVYWAFKQGSKHAIERLNLVEMPSHNPAIEAEREKARALHDAAVKLSAATVATFAQIFNNGFVAPNLSHQFVRSYRQANRQQEPLHAPPPPPSLHSANAGITKSASRGTIKPESETPADAPPFHHPIYANHHRLETPSGPPFVLRIRNNTQ
jgi:hypothetical protein